MEPSNDNMNPLDHGLNNALAKITPALISILTAVVILVLCAWMAAGVLDAVIALTHAFEDTWAKSAEHMIVNALVMLALLELIRTLQAYLSMGRVRVTFILDTALVVLIGEIMGLWFKNYALEQIALSMGVIIILVMLRIATAKYSPEAIVESPVGGAENPHADRSFRGGAAAERATTSAS